MDLSEYQKHETNPQQTRPRARQQEEEQRQEKGKFKIRSNRSWHLLS
jgi:hypothetical protein